MHRLPMVFSILLMAAQSWAAPMPSEQPATRNGNEVVTGTLTVTGNTQCSSTLKVANTAPPRDFADWCTPPMGAAPGGSADFPGACQSPCSIVQCQNVLNPVTSSTYGLVSQNQTSYTRANNNQLLGVYSYAQMLNGSHVNNSYYGVTAGYFNAMAYDSPGGSENMNGIESLTFHHGTGTCPYMKNIQSSSFEYGGGTITDSEGLHIDEITTTTGSKIITDYGINILPRIGSQSSVGLLINSINYGYGTEYKASASNYGIWGRAAVPYRFDGSVIANKGISATTETLSSALKVSGRTQLANISEAQHTQTGATILTHGTTTLSAASSTISVVTYPAIWISNTSGGNLSLTSTTPIVAGATDQHLELYNPSTYTVTFSSSSNVYAKGNVQGLTITPYTAVMLMYDGNNWRQIY